MKDLNYSFSLFILLGLLTSVFGSISFEYPYAFKLLNKNIFVIHKKGISITDPNFTKVTKRLITFTGNERITTDGDYGKITHTMEYDEHIICIIKDKIYVFDYMGNLLDKTTEKITNEEIGYYDLTITKETSSYTLFSIAFVSGSNYCIFKYYYQYNTKKIIYKGKFDSFTTENLILKYSNALSCKYLYFSRWYWDGSQLVCAFYAEREGKKIIRIHKHENMDQSSLNTDDHDIYLPVEDEVIYIKSTQIDINNMLIGWITSKGIPFYAQYNIDKNEAIETKDHHSFNNIKCQFKPQFFKVNIYDIRNDYKEALYTCLMERNTYAANPYADIMLGYFFSFRKTGNGQSCGYSFNKNDTYKYENCTMHGYSIVYFETKNDYYIISDAVCNGIQMPINRLFGELSEEEKQPPVTEAPVSDDLFWESCDNCPEQLCELDLICSSPGDCKDQDYFGDKCDKSCQDINSFCKKCSRDGKCLECTDQSHYGSSCEESCGNCPGSICNFDGTCIDQSLNCIGNKYYGIKCDTECKNEFCEACDRNGNCLKCKEDKYSGNTCQHECKNCPGGTCNINDGKCTNQEDDCSDKSFYGEKCTTSCSNLNPFCKKCGRNQKCFECTDELHFGDDCSQTCANCPGDKCDIHGNCKDGTSNCKNSEYYGNKCDTKCDSVASKELCIKCDRDGTCNECKEGKYWGPSCQYQCEHCPEGLCNMDGTCTKSGDCENQDYFGDKCTDSCQDNTSCKKCNRDGTCAECKDDLHFGNYCTDLCSNCPDGKCDITGKCLNQEDNCKNGEYFGDKCDIKCNDFIGKEHCTMCDRNGNCIECSDDKFWGIDCKTPCGACPEGTCTINDGKCDKEGDCQSQAYFGDMCINSCQGSTHCKLCKKDGTCAECNDKSHFGNECSYICDNCPDAECNIVGKCIDQEKNCLNNFYGENCDTSCDSKCGECDRNGDCISCSDNHYWGSKCQNQCSNCPDGTCDINGVCSIQNSICKDGKHKGSKCDEECDSICEECNMDGICTSCVNKKKWGSNCDKECPNCPDQTCKNDGDCEEQTSDICGNPAYFGPKCDTECSTEHEHCLNCKKESGDCTKCEDSYYGTDCGNRCTNCPGGTCDINGICTDGVSACQDKVSFGQKCDKSCNEACKECDRDGKCTSCKDNHYYSSSCTLLCSNCPEGKCDIEGKCLDQTSDCAAKKFYGENCDQLCIGINNNCVECTRNEICTSCQDNKYKGDKCENSCGACPGGTCNIDGSCLNDGGDFCEGEITHGESCNIPCNSEYTHCSKCYKATGNCIECDEGFYGIHCDQECNNALIRNVILMGNVLD